MTAKATGVRSALNFAARLKEENCRLRSALEVVASCIVRDPSRNAVWLSGEATIVKVVEDVLRRKAKKKTRRRSAGH